MKVKRNLDIDDLFCVECKERIHIGEKYIELEDECYGEVIYKEYHTDCVPEQEI